MHPAVQEHPTSCSAYSKCAAAGLNEGACCPSKQARYVCTEGSAKVERIDTALSIKIQRFF